MIALDTNVVVRMLVDDDVRQHAHVKAFVERAIARHESLFISDVVLCELVWVLKTGYGFQRAAIVDVLRDLLRARHLTFSAPERLARALAAYQAGPGHFADYIIREHATAAACKTVVTFDRALLKDRGFVAPTA